MHTNSRRAADAGFPQGGKGGYAAPPDKIVLRREDRAYCPTLSELIQACGENFAWLRQSRESKRWAAQDFVHEEQDSPHGGQGDTPEEAVARLWLALRTKA